MFTNCFSLLTPLPRFIEHHGTKFHEGSEYSQLFGYSGELVVYDWFTFE